MKYQLPSAPKVYVDVIDDEDVLLMMEEWQEAVASGCSGLRLHLFVEVHLRGQKIIPFVEGIVIFR